MLANWEFADRQYDRSYNFGNWVTVPTELVPGRRNALDFVFFNYDSSFPAELYAVVVESADVSSPNASDRFRTIGGLGRKVELPQIWFSRGFGSNSRLLVVPKTQEGLPVFMGSLIRGSTYTIDVNNPMDMKTNTILLNRAGVM